jgi:uncharacterized RDD family membrane protein YckC
LGGFCCFLLAAFTPRKQALHDLLAGSFVLHHDIVTEIFRRRYPRLAVPKPPPPCDN